MDAFGSLFSVPYQLTTLEAVQHISRVMKDDGVVIFNLGSSIAGPRKRVSCRRSSRPTRRCFPRVYLFKVNADYTDEQLQNLIIVACQVRSFGRGSIAATRRSKCSCHTSIRMTSFLKSRSLPTTSARWNTITPLRRTSTSGPGSRPCRCVRKLSQIGPLQSLNNP